LRRSVSVSLDLLAVLFVVPVSGLLAVAVVAFVVVGLLGGGVTERFAVAGTGLRVGPAGFALGRRVVAWVVRFAVVEPDRPDVVVVRRLVGAGVGLRADVLLGRLADELGRRPPVVVERLALVATDRLGAAVVLVAFLVGADRLGFAAAVTFFFFFVSTIYCYLDR
jgi:hypothetical protein